MAARPLAQVQLVFHGRYVAGDRKWDAVRSPRSTSPNGTASSRPRLTVWSGIQARSCRGCRRACFGRVKPPEEFRIHGQHCAHPHGIQRMTIECATGLGMHQHRQFHPVHQQERHQGGELIGCERDLILRGQMRSGGTVAPRPHSHIKSRFYPGAELCRSFPASGIVVNVRVISADCFAHGGLLHHRFFLSSWLSLDG
jgi:hypothetical protein